VTRLWLIGCNRVHDQTNEAPKLQSNNNVDPAHLSGGIASRSTSSGRASPLNLRSNGRGGTASVPKKSVDVLGMLELPGGVFRGRSAVSADPTAAEDENRMPIAPSDRNIASVTLAPIIGDSRSIDPQKWDSLSANERMAFIQRWLIYAEVKYKGPVDDWSEAFAKEWHTLKNSPSASLCLIAASQKVIAGRSLLNYVARVMEGELPDDVQQWKALYIQAYHIIGSVNRACTSLQCKVDAALAEIS
jgi:hypothetical protein